VETGITESALYSIIRESTDNLFPDGEGAGPAGVPLPPATAGPSGALETSTWDALVRAAAPRQKPFLALKGNLERLQTIRRLGGWPTIPDGRRLRPGCRDWRLPLLRRRLIISGDLGLESHGVDERYDDAVAAGVRRFQQRHGVEIDGVVGARTLAALNATVEERIAQIKLNMLRWRRLPEQMGPRYLLANIPGFRLDVVNDHQVVRTMRTIVGKPERHTPVMSAMITYLEINPYWNIPRQIAITDLLPKIQTDPRFLLRNHIQVFDSWRENAPTLDPLTIHWERCTKDYFPFRLRQKPSAANALGRIKFMFPNRFSVYIHDTPAKSLFEKTNRSFSSGCVRVEQPVVLADWLLTAQGWDRDRIEAKVKRGDRTVVVLTSPVPVYLVYMTAWADDDDTVHFYHDLYGRDQGMLNALHPSGGPPGIRPEELMAVDRILGRRIISAASALRKKSDAYQNS
jgi:L,D-transpeptidase YcbB